MDTTLEFALRYVALGWKVVPCHKPIFHNTTVRCSCGRADCGSIGKHPRTLNGLKNASSDPDTVKAMWAKYPGSNIAVVGVGVIIDIDPKNGGKLESLGLTEAEVDTPCAISGSGGYHIVYAQPEGREPLGNGRGNLPQGIDVRGHAGYIIAAPSLHASGSTYQWIEGYEPWTTPMLPLPKKLLDLIVPPPVPPIKRFTPLQRADRGGYGRYQQQGNPEAYARAALRRAIEKVEHSLDGDKRGTLLRSSINLGGFIHMGLSEEEVASALFDAIKSRAKDKRIAIRAIEDGLRMGMERPHVYPQDPAYTEQSTQQYVYEGVQP